MTMAEPIKMDGRFMAACFVVLGGGVTLLHLVQSFVQLPNWAVGVAIGGFGFVLMGLQSWMQKKAHSAASTEQNDAGR